MNAVSEFIYNLVSNCLDFLGVYAPILACFLILIESMIPVLPLFVFITVNFIAFGPFFGFIISWIFTILGCMISFHISRKLGKKKVNEYIDKHQKIKKITNLIGSFSLSKIAVVLAIPFTPAFAINIAAGLTKMEAKKYLLALMIGKIFLVYFLGLYWNGIIRKHEKSIHDY